MNLKTWLKYVPLRGDHRLVEFLTDGFPLGMNSEEPEWNQIVKHYFAQAYPILPPLVYLISDIMNIDNPKLIKTDIAKAFRNIRLDPVDALNCAFLIISLI